MNWLRVEYNLLLGALALPLTLFTLGQAVRRGGTRFAKQRLGWGYPRTLPRPVWLHAASVGELMAALPLLDALRAKLPHTPFVVTTGTATGAQLAATRLPGDVTHMYLPVDLHGAVKRFLNALRPRCALIMETEVWPNLYSTCHRRGIPLLIVNGRLSDKTLKVSAHVRAHYRAALSGITAILARSEPDRERFIALGAEAKNIETLGNIKYAQTTIPEPTTPPLMRPYVLAASTHGDEEARIARAWLGLPAHQRPLLVIAPRHPQRKSDIVTDLEHLKITPAVRSAGDAIRDDTVVYLADTLGELQRFIDHAELVFIGGSLVPVGGHNVLEPARAGKAQLFGPHMQNFAEESRELIARDAAIQVRDDLELRTTLARLLAAPQRRTSMGQRGRMLILENHDVAVRYVEAITRYGVLA